MQTNQSQSRTHIITTTPYWNQSKTLEQNRKRILFRTNHLIWSPLAGVGWGPAGSQGLWAAVHADLFRGAKCKTSQSKIVDWEDVWEQSRNENADHFEYVWRLRLAFLIWSVSLLVAVLLHRPHVSQDYLRCILPWFSEDGDYLIILKCGACSTMVDVYCAVYCPGWMWHWVSRSV